MLNIKQTMALGQPWNTPPKAQYNMRAVYKLKKTNVKSFCECLLHQLDKGAVIFGE